MAQQGHRRQGTPTRRERGTVRTYWYGYRCTHRRSDSVQSATAASHRRAEPPPTDFANADFPRGSGRSRGRVAGRPPPHIVPMPFHLTRDSAQPSVGTVPPRHHPLAANRTRVLLGRKVLSVTGGLPSVPGESRHRSLESTRRLAQWSAPDTRCPHSQRRCVCAPGVRGRRPWAGPRLRPMRPSFGGGARRLTRRSPVYAPSERGDHRRRHHPARADHGHCAHPALSVGSEAQRKEVETSLRPIGTGASSISPHPWRVRRTL